MKSLLVKFLSYRMRTKISLTIFFIILIFSLGMGFGMKSLILEKTDRMMENAITNMLQLNEDTILKNLLEENYWDIFKIMYALKQTNLIKDSTFVDRNYKVIVSSKPEDYPIGYQINKTNFTHNNTMVIPLQSEHLVFGYFLIEKEFGYMHTFSKDINQRLLFIIIFAALISILVGHIIATRIVSRLELLAQNAKRIEEEKWDEITQVKCIEKDEITELANVTNHMINKIQAMITQEQKMKHFYYNILKNLNALILIFDKDFNMIFNNENRLGNLIVKEDHLIEQIHDTLLKDMAAHTGTFILEIQNEKGKTLFLQVAPIKTEEMTVISFSNITAFKKMEEKILFKHSFEIVGEISSEVVHEIKNYLQPIKILLEQDNMDQEDRQRVLNIIHKINIIVQNFLTRGKTVEKDLLTRIHLKEKIESILSVFAERFDTKQIELVQDLDILAYIYMAESDFDSIVTNLLSNAIEACENNGQITIKCLKNKENIILEVANTGKEIDQEIIKNIHKPFFTTKKGGSGMGLYIVYKIVYLYGGFIMIDSNENSTLFSIHLPKGDKNEHSDH